jgi:hypothetical protein
MRWQLIKSAFSRRLPSNERISQIRSAKGERGIWQRRYWEHTIRDEIDFVRHVDYVHINPVRHGLVDRVRDWRRPRFIVTWRWATTQPIGRAISRRMTAIMERGDRKRWVLQGLNPSYELPVAGSESP